MLVLSSKDMAALVSYEEILAAVREGFGIYEDGAYHMPERIHVDHGEKTLLYMPCFLEDIFGSKLLTIFPENVKKGVPALDGLMLLNDLETGAPLCLMDGKTLTALRTGAVGGLAIEATTPETVQRVGLIGAGAQGLYQLIYACKVREFRQVYLYDAYRQDYTDFLARLRPALPPGVAVTVCSDARSLLEQAEVVITATTATAPVLPEDEGLLRGRHFVGIGSYKPGMREFPDALFPLLERVYMDADAAEEESGDLIGPLSAGLLTKDQLCRFGRLLRDPEAQKRAAGGTSLVKSVGIAVFDMVTARLLYGRAREMGFGYQV